MDAEFAGVMFEWRGPSPFHWLAVPGGVCAEVRAEAAEVSYGWGAIPVAARIGVTDWETSLLPKDGGYVLPIKTSVRARERLDDGDLITVAVSIVPRGGRPANGTRPPR